MLVTWLKPAKTPEIVTVNVPILVLLLVANVSVLELIVGFGLNEALTPFRRPEAEMVTAPLKPFDGTMLMVAEPVAPRLMLRLVGEAARVKSGVAVTVKETVVELLRLPLTPLTVTVKVPGAAEALTAKVAILVLVVPFGLKDTVAPAGSPEADKLTLPLKPFCGVTAIVELLLFPATTFKLLGVAERLKLPGGGAEAGQLFTRFAALMVPMPVAKSHPSDVP
jgi:hypothetical protein